MTRQLTTTQLTGGPGRFAAAAGSLTATVKALVQLTRSPDCSCSSQKGARHEAGKIAASGALSF
jgi:hypothetical protein